MVTTRPAANSYIIKRPRLTTLLDETDARIILLCAPAGYGKTTLAREWSESRSEPVVWYRGGIEMLDAAAVGRTLVEVLQGIGLPEADAARLAGRASRNAPPADLGRAIGAALPTPSGSILVIDDYHYAEASDSEALIGAFVAETDLRIVLTSRTRPEWLTSRMQVYGEAFVLGPDELAFTDDEASAVLGDGVATRDSFVAQACGWPAVIGLAASRNQVGLARSTSLLPTEVYDYFVEDLLRRSPSRLHEKLFLLALTGGGDGRVTKCVLGDDYERNLSEAADHGFIGRGVGLQFEMHPLLRTFLLTKLHELDEDRSEYLVMHALHTLGHAHRWDECLAVFAEFSGHDLATPLLESALDELLASGRLATIKRWLTLVPERERENAVLLLAEAEVAIREGLDGQAQTLAEQASAASSSHELAARAHLVAARAAHMRCDAIGALANAGHATTLTRLSHVRIEALRIELMTAAETESGRGRELLKLLSDERQRTPEQTLFLRHATGYLAMLADGDVRRALRDLEPGLGLVRHVSNPLARTAFLNVLATTWLWLAEYERALEVADLQIDDARASGLDFAEDHALITRIGAYIGLRRLGSAQRILTDFESRTTSSAFITNEIHLNTARLRVAAGDLARAETALRTPISPDGLTRNALGERLASRGLYLAALGDLPGARAVIHDARRASSYIQTQCLGTLALVIADLRTRGAQSDARSREALVRMIAFGQKDALVLACRAYPPLAQWAVSHKALAREFASVLAGSRDVDIGRAAGLEIPRELRRAEALSAREREVYELMAQGRSNREIAKTLFISESTTKVHVRHIFEKLRVHTRAEAVAMNSRAET